MLRRQSRSVVVVALVAMAGWFAMLQAQQPAADLVLTNGKIVTVDERFTVAQAVAIRGDRILAVGSNQDIGRLAGPATRRIDLRGRSVTPGLIDNHMHLLRAATTWDLELRWEGVYSRKQAIETLKARAKAVSTCMINVPSTHKNDALAEIDHRMELRLKAAGSTNDRPR